MAAPRRRHKKVSAAALLDAHRAALCCEPVGALERQIAGKRLDLMVRPLGAALRTAATLRAAMEIFDRFWILTGSIYAVDIEPHADCVRIVFSSRVPHPQDLAASIQAAEMLEIWWLVQSLLGTRFAPRFCAGSDGVAVLMAALSGEVGGHVTCGPEPWIELPPGALDQPLGRADSGLHAEAVADCQREARARARRATLLERIDQELAHLDDGAPSIGHVSRQLGLSERTLRRRLNESGTCYNRLLEERRLSIAKTWLVDGKASTAMIAEKLGYSEPSNFRHAFKRWTGSSPAGFGESGWANDRKLETAA